MENTIRKLVLAAREQGQPLTEASITAPLDTTGNGGGEASNTTRPRRIEPNPDDLHGDLQPYLPLRTTATTTSV